MARKDAERPGANWYSRAEICEFQGITQPTFDRTYRPLVPPAGEQTIGSRVWFHGPTYWEAVLEYKLGVEAKKNATRAPSDDPFATGKGDLEALKRIQRATADEKEYRVAAMLKKLVPIDELRPVLMEFAVELKRAGEMLQRQFGPEAAGLINETLIESMKRWEKLFNGENRDMGPASRDGGASKDPPA